MRHVLLATLLTGSSFGQDPSSPAIRPKPAITVSNQNRGAQPIAVEVRFLSGSPEVFQKLNAGDLIRTAQAFEKTTLPAVSDQKLRQQNGIQLVSATRVVEEHTPVFVRRIDDKRVFDLLRAAKKDERARVLSSPKLTLFSGRHAEIVDGAERPFVVALKQTETRLEPQIRIVPTGTAMQLRATIKPDAVRLDLVVKCSEVTNVETKAAGPANAFVQIPRIATSRVALSALVEDGGTLVVSGLQRTVEVRKEQKVLGMFKNSSVGRSTESMIILITPRVIVREAGVGRARLDGRVTSLLQRLPTRK